MSSKEQPTGSMLMTRQEEEQRHTHRETGPRHKLQTAVNRGMYRPRGESDTRMSMTAQRGGDHRTETLLISKPPHISDPGSENLTKEAQDTFVHAHTHSSYYKTIAEKHNNHQLFKYTNIFLIFSQS